MKMVIEQLQFPLDIARCPDCDDVLELPADYPEARCSCGWSAVDFGAWIRRHSNGEAK